MTEFDALYYDGRSAARTPVRVSVLGDRLHFVDERVDLQVPVADVAADSPIASGPSMSPRWGSAASSTI